MNVTLTGKKIVITGGTGTLGTAFVMRALQEGAQIFFTYHTNEAKARELTAAGAKGFRVDLRKADDIHAFRTALKQELGALDGLIHNAAVVRDKTLNHMSEAEWDEVLSVDLKAVYLLTKELLRFLMKREYSKVLAVVSRSGLGGSFGQTNYAAAKGGVIAFMKSFARELGRKKILVNCFNPGFMVSHMTRTVPPEIFEKNKAESVLGTLSDPGEAADLMVYLMSDKVKHASGQLFHYETRQT